MSNCINCYHCVEQDDGTYFCFIKGFLKNFGDVCLEFHLKNEKIQACPNCTSVYRQSSNFCKQCAIYKELEIKNELSSKDIGFKNEIILPFYKELHYVLKV